MYSLFRRATYSALSECTLSGSIIDLGGTHDADYHKKINGNFTVTTVNIDAATHANISADLEKPLPVQDAQFDGAMLINVMEHIYHTEQLMSETFRVIKPGAPVIAVVPFLFPIHPSPDDFYRFTDRALERIFSEAGFKNISITPIAPGVMRTRHVFIARLWPQIFSNIFELPYSQLAIILDALLVRASKALGKQYLPTYYPLGYLVRAEKQC